MHFRCIGPIWLGAVILSVTLAVSVKKPFGHKMCECFCNQIVGCSSGIYRTSDLSCHPTHASSPTLNLKEGIYVINATKDKKWMHTENAVNCSPGEKIFRTRRGIIKCRTEWPKKFTHPNKGEVSRGRILMLSSIANTLSKPARQLYLGNNRVVNYPFIHTNTVLAIAYIPSHRKLVVSHDKPNQLFFMPMDGEKKIVIKAKCKVRAIAIDDNKELVFMKVTSPNPGVSVMSTSGKNISLLFSVRHCTVDESEGFAADHNRSLIYVLCVYWKLLQFTYQGFANGYVHVDGTGGYLYKIHMQGDIMYYFYQRNNVLHKLSLSDHSVTRYNTSLGPVDTMLSVGNTLYVIPSFFRDQLVVVDVSDKVTVTKVNVGFKRNVFKIVMCLIP